jgi:hypothetical protein
VNTYLRFDINVTIQFTTFTTHQHQRKVNNMEIQQIVHPKHCEVIYRYNIYIYILYIYIIYIIYKIIYIYILYLYIYIYLHVLNARRQDKMPQIHQRTRTKQSLGKHNSMKGWLSMAINITSITNYLLCKLCSALQINQLATDTRMKPANCSPSFI